jgi:CubicO group peptidase (beta-lactamase class C family)
MPFARPVTLLLLAALSLRCASSRVDTREVDRILEQQRAQQHIPGLALAIVKDDRVVYVATIGQRDIERNLPVTENTMFPIGSCTKAFTSMAIALAQDRGMLSLDDHPRKFLPYFRMADHDADAQVTLRDMLGHRTGLKAYADLAAEPGVLTREEYVRAATTAKPAVPFRSAFQYSNAMYSAAGEIVGKVHNSSWERVIETEIFGPLGMTSSVADLRAMTPREHVNGYVYAADHVRAVPPPRSLEALAPGGAIASSVRDMAKWLRMLTAGGQGFVSSKMFHELTAPLMRIDAEKSYALGWATYDWNGLRVVEHNGGSQGISALISFVPERHAGFVFLANTSPNFMTKIGNAGNLLWPLILNEHAPAAAPPPAVAKKVAADVPRAADISVETLLARMREAAGGEEALRRHTSLEIHARKSYENHGVAADLTVQSKAPAMHNEVEEWTAAGRHLARVRVYFDGTNGGQETTFGQDAINDAAANDRARREYVLHPLLEMKPLSVGRTDEAWVVKLEGSSLYVSTRTLLIIKREAPGEVTTFDDYRAVDGEQIAFRTTIDDALGETSIAVTSAAFNVAIPDAVFMAQSDRAASSPATATGSSPRE